MDTSASAAPSTSATPSTGTAPSAAPATPSTPAAPTATAPSAPAVSDWVASLNDESKALVAKKQFENVDAILKSYAHMESAFGVPKERLLKLPENLEDPKSMEEVYAKLGRPAKAEDYKLGEKLNPEFNKWAQGTFHELGLSAKQAAALADKYAEFAKTSADTSLNAQKLAIETEVADLKKKWGGAYDQHLNAAKAAIREFGVEDAAIDALENAFGYTKVMELFQKIGASTGESKFVNGSQSRETGHLTPEVAIAEINTLRGDPEFTAKYLAGEATAKKRMTDLHRMAYGE